MKHFYVLLLLVSSFGFAQIPAGYYDYATGTGYTLKSQLKKIINAVDDIEISNTLEQLHQDQGYDAIDGFMASYDLDNYYEVGSNTILDMYSENPSGSDPYTYSPINDECGNYNSEGDCYNKEHVIPASVFNDATPMYSDAHELIPSDGRVNGFRSNMPFGVVDDNQLVSQSGISNPTQNGSKVGNNLNSGYSAGYTGVVFEPIDEFKGDLARIYFYFATRYEDQINAWSSFDMFDGSNDKVFTNTFLSILLTWHSNDPVSQKEIDRNNNIFYNHQNNRNPFIDFPEYVNLIWSVNSDTENPTNPTNLIASNPTDNTINLDWTVATDNLAVTSYDVYIDGVISTNVLSNSTLITSLAPGTNYCFTVKALDNAGNQSGFSNQSCQTTTNNGTGSAECLTETFENIGSASSQYANVNWVGDNGGNWSATDARTDQTLNTKSITIRNGVLTLPTTAGGIGELTLTTQRIFGGSSGTFNLNVNGNLVGTIAYSDTAQTLTIPNINIENNVSVVIDGNSTTSNRVKFDDISYTCYSVLNVDQFNNSSIKLYPNPIKKNLTVNLKLDTITTVEIYDLLGKRVFKSSINTTNNINLQELKAGIYIIKLTQNNASIIKKIIKQ
ncbi:endonuclease [uncultured Winogradskyella sp.]|uniref:endonuclease n=1 Tax=uncultured Winogradskyella sp. TaxID=395353 RepID=UPI0030D98A34|tara:strand:- start:80219 stop:82063 length:1845 start_codon:yes stop_codon:yes gene_type:complete